jgi:hypothetical protein
MRRGGAGRLGSHLDSPVPLPSLFSIWHVKAHWAQMTSEASQSQSNKAALAPYAIERERLSTRGGIRMALVRDGTARLSVLVLWFAYGLGCMVNGGWCARVARGGWGGMAWDGINHEFASAMLSVLSNLRRGYIAVPRVETSNAFTHRKHTWQRTRSSTGSALTGCCPHETHASAATMELRSADSSTSDSASSCANKLPRERNHMDIHRSHCTISSLSPPSKRDEHVRLHILDAQEVVPPVRQGKAKMRPRIPML